MTPVARLATGVLAALAIAAGPVTVPTTAPTTAPSISVGGTWAYTLHVEDLQIDAVAELKQDGASVTGSVTAGVATKAADISNGKLTGGEVEFTVDRVSEVGTQRVIYRGKVDGDTIRGTAEFGWIDVPDHKGMSKADWVATRAKDGTRPPHGVR